MGRLSGADRFLPLTVVASVFFKGDMVDVMDRLNAAGKQSRKDAVLMRNCWIARRAGGVKAACIQWSAVRWKPTINCAKER
jgi:hypothetical protein